jgi:hypothetical protein
VGQSMGGGESAGLGSAAGNFLQQNGVSFGQFRSAVYASAQQSGGTVDLSQLFQNASSGQSINLTA